MYTLNDSTAGSLHGAGSELSIIEFDLLAVSFPKDGDPNQQRHNEVLAHIAEARKIIAEMLRLSAPSFCMTTAA
ncbi:hypothetical protein HNV11_23710 (plasmid) [Spirosoma taeanense]|uniref:Uncharacterized protein n=1 Tax=Spirosoma taeanense TaxID=2735870 RepID=A0A6M5YGL2_9BACT|nr:hypothetical protein [Spirosoma taeanense]QJW92481.1 hypothetical protein HNV11_23710 [Spirosoma taeanense]